MRQGLKRAITASAALCAGLVLAACGNTVQRGSIMTVGSMAADLIGDTTARSGVLGARNLEASDAQLRAFSQPLIKVTRANLGVAAGLVLSDSKGPATTWRSTDEKTVTLFNGLLISTKGFGDDLSSAKVPSVRAGTKDVLREHYYLGGDEIIRRKQYFCAFRDAGRQTIDLVGVQTATTQVVETCQGEADSFENSYWFGSGGGVVKTVQWASPEIGALVIELVPRGGAAAAPRVTVAPAAGGVTVISGSLD